MTIAPRRRDPAMLLVVDNYDSFVFNLVHYVEQLGVSTHVVRNDALSVEDALALRPRAVLLSPGPCTPAEAGICMDLIAQASPDLPILGVCLGHQAIGAAFGGRVISAKEIRHGKTSPIAHDGSGIFAGLPSPFTATRYHSLAIDPAAVPNTLRVTARTTDGEIMGVAHAERPVHGVQFHPESIASEHGHRLLANFLALAGYETADPETLAA
jgi:anthranilate synthase component 2